MWCLWLSVAATTITFSRLLASFPPLTFLTEKSRLITRDFLIRKRERLCNLTERDCLTLCYGNLSPAQLRSYFPPCTAQFSIDLQTFQITNYKLSWLAWMEWRVDLIQHNYKCYNVTDCQQPTQC